jgi:quinoprotein glucose dehydrogenase
MGLYVPLDHEAATLAIPGTIGGANYGHTAADPVRGMVYVISNDGFSIYEPLVRNEAPDPNAPPPEPGAGRGGGGGGGGRGGGGAPPVTVAEVEQGQALYTQQCQVCHLANRTGMGAAPSLLGVETRISGADFLSFLRAGRGEMPAFGTLSDEQIQTLYRYLGGSTDGGVIPLPEGRVVASGGAPGGLLPRPGGRGGGGGGFGAPYPEGVNAPNVRYTFQGYGMRYASISPPWSQISAYDLNTGTLK